MIVTIPAMTRMTAMSQRMNMVPSLPAGGCPAGPGKRSASGRVRRITDRADPVIVRPTQYAGRVVYTSDYPILHVTVDIVVLTVRDDELCALAVRRGEPPYQGRWALPGGFVEIDEDLGDAARRELREETSVSPGSVRLEQLATYGAPGRDPRHRTVSVAWLAVLPHPPSRGPAPTPRTPPGSRPTGCSGGGGWPSTTGTILGDGVERARAKLEYTNIATAFLDGEFMIAELREVYEVVWCTRSTPATSTAR